MTESNHLLMELQQSKQPPLDELAAAMLQDPTLLQAAVEGCAAADEGYRYNSIRCLERVCESGHADLLYPQWDFFVRLLDSRNAFQRAAKIARFKPHLQERITSLLLNIEQVYHNPERVDLLKADVLETFSAYAAASPQREAMLQFAAACKGNASPKTRQAAGKFLKAFG